ELQAPAETAFSIRVPAVDHRVDRGEVHLAADDPARPRDDEDRREAEHEALEVEALEVRADRQQPGERGVRDEPRGERMPPRIIPARHAEQLAPLELADDVRPFP